MNIVKDIFDDFRVIPHSNIDPFNLVSPKGPWIVGSYVLWHFKTFLTSKEPDWHFGDIDYVVHSEEQGQKLLDYFRKTNRKETQKFDTVFKFDNVQIGLQQYEDIRFRLYHHDINICQIGCDNNNFYVSSSALEGIKNNTCCLTGNTTGIYDPVRMQNRVKKYVNRGFKFID